MMDPIGPALDLRTWHRKTLGLTLILSEEYEARGWAMEVIDAEIGRILRSELEHDVDPRTVRIRRTVLLDTPPGVPAEERHLVDGLVGIDRRLQRRYDVRCRTRPIIDGKVLDIPQDMEYVNYYASPHWP